MSSPLPKPMPDEPTSKRPRRSPALTHALTNEALLKQAHIVLERKLAANPRDAKALLGLGEIYRREGKFPQAIAAYRALQKVQRNAAWPWVIGAIGGGKLPEKPPQGQHAAPFVRQPNFLSAEEQRKLRMVLDVGPSAFEPARVSAKSKKRPDIRTALESTRTPVRQVRPWFMPRLRTILPDVAARFRRPFGADANIEITLTATLSGGFYGVHRDDAPNDTDDPAATRTISYAYYFHRDAGAFTGGELLLYDSCLDDIDIASTGTTKRFSTAFSRIDPVHNTLVLFPSCYYHEILPLRGDSDRFQDARFTVNGWVHRPDPAVPCDEAHPDAPAPKQTQRK